MKISLIYNRKNINELLLNENNLEQNKNKNKLLEIKDKNTFSLLGGLSPLIPILYNIMFSYCLI